MLEVGVRTGPETGLVLRHQELFILLGKSYMSWFFVGTPGLATGSKT
jgi:hypothetical protein